MKYNLLEEKWIKCRMLDGTHEEMSLKEVVDNAHVIECFEFFYEISNLAILRLVMSIIARAYADVINKAKYQQIWERSSFDDVIDGYLKKWWNRFDVFDKDYPFYQDKDLDCKLKNINELFDERVRGNNAVYLDHRINSPVDIKKAVVGLISKQGFTVSGGKGCYTPSRTLDGSMFVVEANNLFETIMLNWVVSGKNVIQGIPSWEYDSYMYDEEFSDSEDIIGLMTVLPRRVKLICNADSKIMSEVMIAKGKAVSKDIKDYFHITKKGKDDKIPKNESWKQYVSILKYQDEGVNAIGNIKGMINADVIDGNTKWNLRVYDIECNDSNKSAIKNTNCVDNSFVVDLIGKVNGNDSDVYIGLTDYMIKLYDDIIKMAKETFYTQKKEDTRFTRMIKGFKGNVFSKFGLLVKDRFYSIMLDDILNKDVGDIKLEWNEFCNDLLRTLFEKESALFAHDIEGYIEIQKRCEDMLKIVSRKLFVAN